MRTLVALLALRVGRVTSCDALICGIWGDALPADPANALQTLVKRVRALLPPDMGVEAEAGGYRLRIAPGDIDIHRFAELAETGVGQVAAGANEEAVATVDAALALWRGEPFTGSGDNSDLYWHADRLSQLRLDAIEARAKAYVSLGRGLEVIESLTAELREHPLRESLAVVLIDALVATGRSARAREIFLGTRDRLREELGTTPSRELMEARQRIDGGTASFAPTLPVRLTGLIGRERELGRAAARLRSTRLLTLTGPVGVGKTSLALEAARRSADRWRDGCVLIELAGHADARAATAVILAELGLRGDPRAAHACPVHRPAVAGDRQLLVILDNCEHVLEIAELVADLLARCPNLTVLATSREPLGIAGETLFPVPALAVPAPGATPVAALESPAVQLFLDRARAVRPGFTLSGEDCAAIAAICRRLDGIPLALELAAARVHTLGPAQILVRLDDRFRLLTGHRAAGVRHRSLHTAIEWSWDRLADPERRMAQRLWMFPAGATLDDLQAVCAGDAAGPLSRLVTKSLVEFDGRRYRMLETIHAFVGSTLDPAEQVA